MGLAAVHVHVHFVYALAQPIVQPTRSVCVRCAQIARSQRATCIMPRLSESRFITTVATYRFTNTTWGKPAHFIIVSAHLPLSDWHTHK